MRKGYYPTENDKVREKKTDRQRLSARFHGGGLFTLAVAGFMVLYNGETEGPVGNAIGKILLTFHGLCVFVHTLTALEAPQAVDIKGK